jgi:23S rRNA (uracil1939-C5)-methyltransferase
VPTHTQEEMLKPGSEVELVIESLAQGGRGVGRSDGFVVFVRDAVPGDRVLCVIERKKRTHAEARLKELVSQSPERIVPRFSHPGASWQILSYERQLTEKQAQVTDALSRLGGFDNPPVASIVPSDSQWRYRNKVEYSFGGGPGGLALGFHPPGRFDAVCDIEEDVLAPEVVDRVRLKVKRWLSAQQLSPYDRRTHVGTLRNLVVRQGRRTGELQLRLVTSPHALAIADWVQDPDLDSLLVTQTTAVSETTDSGETEVVFGGWHYGESICGLDLQISPQSFFQTNTEMAERLYEHAAQLAGLDGTQRVFDLFCGIGTIGLAFADHADEVWGIESVESAITDARQNASNNGVDNARFVCGDVRTTLRSLIQDAGYPDVVVCDPPRAGLSKKVVRRVLETRAAKIVYVSCNPTTLAPNARQLVDGGYRLKTIRPVDMFAQTPHIECVALFEALK